MASCVLPLISHLSPTLSPTHCLRYKCRDKNRNGVAWENAACDSRCSQLTWIKICQHQGPVRPQPCTQTLQWIRNNCLCVVAFLVFSKFWLIIPQYSDQKATWTIVHVYSATSHGRHPGVHFCLFFSWFGHPPRKLLELMGGNAAKPRPENRISKQVSAWPLKVVSQAKPSNTYLVKQHFFYDYDFPCVKPHQSLHEVASYCTFPLHKGVQHLFERILTSFSKRRLCEVLLKRYRIYGKRTALF